MSIGLTTRFKNRLSFLQQSLPTWCAIKELSCITIVDWSSEEDIIPLINSMKDKRIQVLRIDNRKWFEPGVCHNVAIRNTNTNLICAIDCDIKITQKFSYLLKLMDIKSFMTSQGGKWNKKLDGLYGSCVFPKKMWTELNGYVEGQIGWGGEDSNFYVRACKAGYIRKNILTLEVIQHQPHSDEYRLKYFPFKAKCRKDSQPLNENWIKTINIKTQKQMKFRGRIYKNGRWSAQEL